MSTFTFRLVAQEYKLNYFQITSTSYSFFFSLLRNNGKHNDEYANDQILKDCNFDDV